MSVFSYFSASLIRFSYSLQLASSFSLSLHSLMSLFSLTMCRVTQKKAHAMPHLADPRTPQAICQLQSGSCRHCTVVTQNLTCWSLYVCSLMIDTTFQLKEIADINQAREKAFKNSSIHALTELSAVITRKKE